MSSLLQRYCTPTLNSSSVICRVQAVIIGYQTCTPIVYDLDSSVGTRWIPYNSWKGFIFVRKTASYSHDQKPASIVCLIWDSHSHSTHFSSLYSLTARIRPAWRKTNAIFVTNLEFIQPTNKSGRNWAPSMFPQRWKMWKSSFARHSVAGAAHQMRSDLCQP